MKKYKDIRIIKEKSSSSSATSAYNNYTFIDNINTSKTSGISSANINDKVNGDHTQTTMDGKNEEKYKKKKVVNKTEPKSRFTRALKFSNPSQRNHSSVYE